MYNGSLDADAMTYLAGCTDELESAAGCNDLVVKVAAWLLTLQEWPAHFVFKGKQLDLSDHGLEYVARYYVMLARVGGRVWQLKTQETEPLVRLDAFWFPSKADQADQEYAELKALSVILSERGQDLVDPPFYLKGNEAVVLMHNYVLSEQLLKHTLSQMKAEAGFPSFRSCESAVKEHWAECVKIVEKAKLDVEQRAQVANMRLHYDSIQREMEALERP
jgi:hypothetical protein